MAVVEVERSNGIMVVRMNRPERMNALNQEVREAMAEAWNEFHTSRELEVGIITGTGTRYDTALCGIGTCGCTGGMACASSCARVLGGRRLRLLRTE